MRKTLPFAVGFLPFAFCLLFFAFPVSAQFKIERVNENQFFQRARNVSFYTNTHFNRVEALQLNLGVKFHPQKWNGFMLFGDAGYGFKNEDRREWRWQTGVQKIFFLPQQFALGADYFNKVDSNDRWLISNLENSLAGLFLHEDFMDHFGRRGVRGYLDYRFNQTHSIRVDVSGHRYEVLQKNSDWSLLGRNKDYPPNVRTAFPAKAGDELAVRLSAVLDGRDNPIFPLAGWYADAQFEITRQDFETEALFLTLKRYQPTFGDQKFQIKLLAGTRSGSRAFQHLLPLGGLGNLRGYREKEFPGDRLLYLNANYIIGQQWLHYIPLKFLPLWESVAVGVFAETGYAWFADSQNADAGLFDLGEFKLNYLRNDVGFSLYFAENLLRVDFARRTDRGDRNWRVTFRILDKF